MKKIELNKKLQDSECPEMTAIWEKTGNGEKCVKLTITYFCDGEKDFSNDVFIKHENIMAESENTIIFVKTKVDTTFSENINADKEGGFSSCEEARKYQIKIAKANIG